MELEPPTYQCAAHEVDLTEQIYEQVAEQQRVLFRRPEDPRFRVLVTCPDHGSPHELGCSGTILDDH